MCRVFTDSVGILFNATVIHAGQVIIDDVHNISDVNATGGDTSGDQDWCLACAESTHGILSLTLSTVRVNRRAGHALVEEIIVQLVSGAL